MDETKNFVKKLCSFNKNINGNKKWEKLIHSDEREIQRKKFIELWKEKSSDESIDDGIEDNFPSRLNSPNRTDERKIIRQAIISNFRLPPSIIHTISASPARANNYKFLSHGSNVYQRSKPSKLESPFEFWLRMEKFAQATENDFQLNSTLLSLTEKEDCLLSNQIFFRFVETFQSQLGIPFSVLLEQSKKHKAEAMLQASFEKEDSHNLADKIENRLNNDDDDDDVTIKRSDLRKLIASEAEAIFTRKMKQEARKKSSREAAVTFQRNASDGASGNENSTKKKKTVRLQKSILKNKKSTNHPYSKQKKTNTQQQTSSLKSSKGKHDFKHGGKSAHQKQNQNKNKRIES